MVQKKAAITNSEQNLPAWAQEEKSLFKSFNSSITGLSQIEAQHRLKIYGPNEIAKKERKSGLVILIEQYINPLILVLIIATIIAFFLGENTEAVIILVIVNVNALLGFSQEYRAEKALRALRKLIAQKAGVIRGKQKIELDSKALVPGDIVTLNIGDIIPADLRLLVIDELTIDEASLTGESVPVEKIIEPIPAEKILPQLLKNMAFMGTHVVSGSGLGMVVSTGEHTFFGKTAAYLKEPETVSDFEKNMGSFSNFLLKIIIVMTFLIFIINTLLNHGIFDSFLFALALAVGITPEALPVIITISLSKGAQKLAKAKVVVKKLNAIEDLGNTDILCTDKTGTLTEGKLSLENYFNADGKSADPILIYSLLCNNAIPGKKKVEGNIIDRAIWESHQKNSVLKEFHKFKILDHNEFDFHRRRMSVVIQNDQGERFLVVKGAMESLLPVSSKIHQGGKDQLCDQSCSTKYLDITNQYRRQGYSTIHLAIKKWHSDKSSKDDEKDLTLLGFLVFLDPPRESAKKSLARLQNLGVAIKVLSGDDPLVTEAICKKVNLQIDGNRIISGDELDKMNLEEFSETIEKYNVFSRITPDHKYKIVNTLNKGPERTIAFLGDGINDAPALKTADVGISVNTATDIAKEAADIILLQKGLGVIADGITEGRKIFTNIKKYILNTISANFGNMFTVAFSSLFLTFIPLLPSQILLNNLITDVPMLSIATDNTDDDQLRKPKKLDLKMVNAFMTYFGLISTVFDLTLIITLLVIFKTQTEVFRTAWFLESALSELIVTFAIRTRQSFWKSKPSNLLLEMSAGAVVIICFLVFTPLRDFFQFAQLNVPLVAFITLIIFGYFATAEIAKRFFFRKYEW